jgi:CHASE2 domain-containing sensor protein
MADEPSAAELSPDEAYRSIGRYVYEFTQLISQMRAIMTRYLNTSPQGLADLAFAQSDPDQIATAFFAMCRAAAQLDLAEEKTASRLRTRVGEAIEMRDNVAHGDWWVGSSVLGAEAVELSARELDGRSDSLATLTNIVAEYGTVCLRIPPYDVGQHRVSDYIVMRAGEAVREGPKALDSPHVFYSPPLSRAVQTPRPSIDAPSRTVREAAPDPAPAPRAEPEHLVPPPAPEHAATLEREPAPAAEPEPVPAAAPPPSVPTPGRVDSLRHRAARGLAAAAGAARHQRAPQAPLRPGTAPRRLTHQRLRRAMLALAGLTAALLAVGAYEGNVFGSLELKTIDARFSIRGAQPPRNIVIVAIDNNSVAHLGGYPFPRRYHADVIDRLHAAGARAIGYDVQFTSQTDPTDDNDLVDAVSRARGIVLSTTFITKTGNTNVLGESTSGITSQLGAYVGNGDVLPDGDGVLRHIVLSYSKLTTFAVVLAERVMHHPVPRSDFPGGAALVDFSGPGGTIPQISFLNVLQGRYRPGFFRGKIVLVGVTAQVAQDVHATAVDPTMSGVEFQANAVSSILRGNPLRDAAGSLNLLAIVLLAIVMPLMLLWLRPGLVLVVVALAVAAIYLVVAQLSFNSGTVLSVVYPLVALTLGTVEATAADLWAERRQRSQLEVYKTAYEALPSTESAAFFISYRRDQSSWPARILRDELVRRFGEDQVFKDNDSIQAGQEWPERLEAAIRNASVVLVLIGPQWAEARGNDGELRLENPEDWVRLEVEAALAHDGAAVVPVLVDGASMPPADKLPDTLRPLTEHQAFALSVERWNADLEALIESIHSGRIRDFLAREHAARDQPASP